MLKQIPINEKPLKDEHRESDKYHEIRGTMEQNLARTDKIRRYATHESGHLIFLAETVLIAAPEDYIFEGPTIYSDGDEIGYFVAAVTSKRARLSDETLVYTEELLDKLSLVAAAGTVFEKEIEGEDEETAKASNGDENVLHKHCYKAMTDFHILFEGYTLWPRAKQRVTEYVRKNRPDLEFKIDTARSVICSRCFGLNDVPHAG